MAKFKPYRKDQLHLLPACLEDYVPEGHLARLVYEVVEGLDTSAMEDRYSELVKQDVPLSCPPKG